MTSPHNSPNLPADDDQNAPRDRIDADPPYGTAFPDKVKRFRELLAALIARRILTDRQGKEESDDAAHS